MTPNVASDAASIAASATLVWRAIDTRDRQPDRHLHSFAGVIRDTYAAWSFINLNTRTGDKPGYWLAYSVSACQQAVKLAWNNVAVESQQLADKWLVSEYAYHDGLSGTELRYLSPERR